MDLLLRLVTPRRVFVALLLLGGAKLLAPRVPEAYRSYVAWRYPPVAADPGGAAAARDIALDEARRRALHVQALSKTADDVLAAARARGDDVARVEAKCREADAAASSDPKRAAELLNQVIAETPAAPMGVLPLARTDADEEQIEPDAAGKRTDQFVDSGFGPAKKRRAKGRR